MSTVLVTGGTGHRGRDLVELLTARQRGVRVLARTPGSDPGVEWAQGDLATGEGLAAAVQGVQAIVHAATLSPIARRGMRPIDLLRSPPTVDLIGTLRLLTAAERAEVEHVIHVSIVGLEHGAGLPYAGVKLEAEELVRQSPVPWSIVRATPYYYLIERTLAGIGRLLVWPVPDVPWQPVDTPDVAAYLCECLDDGKRGDREQIGGPEVLSFVEIARQYQRARGSRHPVIPIPLPDVIQRQLRANGITVANGRRGKRTWWSWLLRHVAAGGQIPAK